MTAPAHPTARAFRAVERVLSILAGVALLAMMLLTFVDVVGRYGFNRSVFGTAEYIELLMTVVVFAGLAFISATDRHIKVELFEPWLLRRAPNVQRWSMLAFSFVMYLVLTVQLCRYALDSFANGKRTAVLDLPQWYLSGSGAFLCLSGVFLFAAAILTTRGFPRRLVAEDDQNEGDGGPTQNRTS